MSHSFGQSTPQDITILASLGEKSLATHGSMVRMERGVYQGHACHSGCVGMGKPLSIRNTVLAGGREWAPEHHKIDPNNQSTAESGGRVWEMHENACGVCAARNAVGTKGSRTSVGGHSGPHGCRNRELERFRTSSGGRMGKGATRNLVAERSSRMHPYTNVEFTVKPR